MKRRVLNACLVLTSLLGYLEWGVANKMFLFQVELEMLKKLYQDPVAVAHALTLIPLTGQVLLIVSLFQKTPGRVITLAGLAGLSVLLILMFLTGLFLLNFKILLSTIPFFITAVLTVLEIKRK